MLWPFVVAEAINAENTLSIDNSGLTPLQKMAASNAPIQLREQHAWGCPVHVLEGNCKILRRAYRSGRQESGFGHV